MGELITYTGRMIDPLKPGNIWAEDIFFALKHIVRFTGHACPPITVLNHSMNVSEALKAAALAMDLPERDMVYLQILGLLHDAPEAYIGDIPTPFKKRLAYYNAETNAYVAVENLEARWFDSILEFFNLRAPTDQELLLLKMADEGQLQRELRDRTLYGKKDNLKRTLPEDGVRSQYYYTMAQDGLNLLNALLAKYKKLANEA